MRRRFQRENCSVARSLEILGDWWTLLLIREAFVGTRRFVDFQRNLDISRNILTRRLGHLSKHGIFERVDVGVHGRRREYVLTAKGKDLLTVVTAMREWGDRWIFGRGNEPLLFVDRRTERPVPALRLRDENGAPLRARDAELRPGPGATKRTLERFALAASCG